MAGNSQPWLLFAGLTLTAVMVSAQTGRTVRHVRVPIVENSVAPEIAQAESAIEKKDYATAEKVLQAYVPKNATDFRAWYDLGYLYSATGRDQEAIAAYRKSVAAKPDVFESNLNLGVLLAKDGNPDAVTFLHAATQLKPNSDPQAGHARAWDALGHALERSSPSDAVAAYEKAAELQPRDPEPHLSSAILLEKQKDYPAAEKQFQAVATLDPTSQEAIAGLANIYMREKRLPEAEAMLRKNIAANPTNATAHVQLGRVLAAENKTDEAVAEFQAGLRDSPDDPDAIRELAGLAAASKKYDEAAAQYRTLLQRFPNDGELHYALGSVLKEQHKFAEAERELITALRLKPDITEAYGDLAVVANENKDYALAMKVLDVRAKFMPETPATYFMRATIYDNLQQYPQAADYYRKFLQVANGKYPDQEWQARHRLVAIDPKAKSKKKK